MLYCKWWLQHGEIRSIVHCERVSHSSLVVESVSSQGGAFSLADSLSADPCRNLSFTGSETNYFSVVRATVGPNGNVMYNTSKYAVLANMRPTAESVSVMAETNTKSGEDTLIHIQPSIVRVWLRHL